MKSVPIAYPLLAILLAALSALGPFSIDTYLPAFPAMQADLETTQLAIQQTLTAYMLPFAIMTLWHGAISDALGRKRVILVSLACFALASLVCVLATRIEVLWLGRILQGLSAGGGMIVARAMVRDLFEGPAAQRLMSHVAMVFALAPAVAPILGGYLFVAFGWRSIFVFLVVLTLLLIALAWWRLPETLPHARRQALHPGTLLKAYATVLGHLPFVLTAAALAFFFNGFFLYVLSAPVFLMQHLQLGADAFGWMFVPLVLGMICGSAMSARLAGKLSPTRTIALAYTVMAVAALLNLASALLLPAHPLYAIAPLPLYTLGMGLAMPSVSLLGLDMFADRRGMAASCQAFIHTLVGAVAAGLLAPELWHARWLLALGMLGCLCVSAISFGLYRLPLRK